MYIYIFTNIARAFFLLIHLVGQVALARVSTTDACFVESVEPSNHVHLGRTSTADQNKKSIGTICYAKT